MYIVDSSGNQIGITDYNSVNQAFQEVNYAIIDSIEFSLDPGTGKLKYNSKHSNVEINQVWQNKTWKEAETTIMMYPSDDKGTITGRPKGMKSKLDIGTGANIMSLSTYKSINPSDFDKDGNPTGNFQRASTGLKSFEGQVDTTIWYQNHKVCLGQETVVIKCSHCRCRRTHPDRVRNNAEARLDTVSSPSSYL